MCALSILGQLFISLYIFEISFTLTVELITAALEMGFRSRVELKAFLFQSPMVDHLMLVGSDFQIHASLPLMMDTVVSSWENSLSCCRLAAS